jgi:hypothetical protein
MFLAYFVMKVARFVMFLAHFVMKMARFVMLLPLLLAESGSPQPTQALANTQLIRF